MKEREVKPLKSGCKRSIEIPEEIWIEILARLPFRSLMGFKAVCRRWRKVLETEYFRSKFMFVHRNSPSSWSIMHGTYGWPYEEVIAFYECERYGIPRSLGSYIPPHDERVDENVILACVDGLVLLQNKSNKEARIYSVGNPVLNQWVQLPPHPSQGFNYWVGSTSLVTRVKDGVVVEYKVIFMDQHVNFRNDVKTLKFEIYSSETGKWIRKRVSCPSIIVSLSWTRCLSLNKKLHWLDEDKEAFVAYDFFASDEQQKCRFIPFPDDKTCFGRTYTTSEGFLVYISKKNSQLKLWRLEEYTSDSGIWKLMQNINLRCLGGLSYHYFPIAMHPFETHIIYMGTYESTLISIDLKTLKRTYHTKSSTYSDTMLSHYKRDNHSSLYESRHHQVFYAPQFILPQWMESVPHLPLV